MLFFEGSGAKRRSFLKMRAGAGAQLYILSWSGSGSGSAAPILWSSAHLCMAITSVLFDNGRQGDSVDIVNVPFAF